MILKPEYRFKPIKTVENIWGFDSEDDSKGYCIQAGVFNGSRFLIYEDINIHRLILLFKALVKTGEKHYFFSNNILYDLVNVFGYEHLIENLDSGEMEFIISKYNFIGAVYCRNIFFVDLQNYYRNMSLGKIGELIGLKKLEFNPTSKEYLKRDIEISYFAGKNLIDFLAKNKFDFGLTIPSIALQIFKRYFLKTSFEETDEKTLDLLRTGYKGGRCEMYWQGERSPVHIYDINSLYPYIMTKTKFFNPNTIKPSFEIKENGFYKVRLKLDENLYLPLFPHELNSIYPVGEFNTIALGSDLLPYKNNIQNIQWGVEFDYSGYLFKSYAVQMYQKRKNSLTSFDNTFFKILMNGLYGKFGQSKMKTVWKKGEGFTEENLGYSYYSQVIWSIQITCGARSYMFDRMNRILDKGIECYYTDTDSVHCSREIPKKYVDSKTLGFFKNEGRFESFTYLREKEYYSNDFKKYACKGISGKENVETYFKTGKANFKSPIKFKESLRRGIQANIWIDREKVKRQSKQKRQVFSDGSTKPLIFNENPYILQP